MTTARLPSYADRVAYWLTTGASWPSPCSVEMAEALSEDDVLRGEAVAQPQSWRNTILVGDVREKLRELPDESVHCVVCSPPYWGLRDYGVESTIWGGDDDCEHLWGATIVENATNHTGKERWQHTRNGRDELQPTEKRVAWLRTEIPQGSYCQHCGAWYGNLGLEPTPELFVQNLVAVFREVRRVLRKDGTVWLNLGDCYSGSGRGMNGDGTQGKAGPKQATNVGSLLDMHDKRVEAGVIGRYGTPPPAGLKPKDLVGMPWRVAFALQADGWWLRSDIVWSKPNPMPESVTDRPTKSHEYVFLLAKSERYYYDIEAIREPVAPSQVGRVRSDQVGGNLVEGVRHSPGGVYFRARADEYAHYAPPGQEEQTGLHRSHPSGRNRRTVWEIPTQPYAEAHFATYPEALVLPCIQAGTSEHGCCSECGAPWRRVVEREPLTDETKAAFEAGRQRNGDETGRSDGYAAYKPHQERAVLSTRWEPTCKHATTHKHFGRPHVVPYIAPVERAVVLDPFMGSGTTGLVAYNAGRDFVGVELNPAYAEMAERRIGANRGRLL